jgi:DNA-binding response OmpR family regulator
MAKILLVDDDRELCTTVAYALRGEHHTVEMVHAGDEGLHRMICVPYDLIIIDLNIGDMDGIEICKEYRKRGGVVPILMLTGRGDSHDKEQGLDGGADDYVTKPFNIKELSARVRAILRRPLLLGASVIRINQLTLDCSKYTVCKNGRELQFMPVDFALLEFLMKHPNQVYSGQALIERVWHTDKEVSSEALRSSIKRIRQQIDDADSANSMIETIPRVGYRLKS